MSTLIQCPHCEGSGMADHDGYRWCAVCGNNDKSGPDWGVLELPLSPDHADAIYDAGCACCEQLVSQPWDREGDQLSCVDCGEDVDIYRCWGCAMEAA